MQIVLTPYKQIMTLLLFNISVGCANLDQKISDSDTELPPPAYGEFLPPDFERRLTKLKELAKFYGHRPKLTVYIDPSNAMSNMTNNCSLQLGLQQTFYSAISLFGDTLTNSAHLQKADVVIQGVIDQCDERVSQQDSTSGVDFAIKHNQEWLDIFAAKNRNSYKSNLGVTINAMKNPSLEFISQISTAVQAEIIMQQASGNYGVVLSGIGFDHQANFQRQNGLQSSVKLLIYFATAEALSKLLEVPYWLIFSELRPNSIIQTRLAQEFHCELAKEERDGLQKALQKLTNSTESYLTIIGAEDYAAKCPTKKPETQASVPAVTPKVVKKPQRTRDANPAPIAENHQQEQTKERKGAIYGGRSGRYVNAVFQNWNELIKDKPIPKQGPSTLEVFGHE